jgi:hypothetical protein
MKSIIKNILIRSFLVLGLLACSSDFLDINIDPNNPANASLDLLLPAAQVSAAFNTTRTIHQDASIFVQHFYTLGSSTYNVVGSNYSNDFSGIYNGALKDFETIIAQAGDRGIKGYVGIAKVMKAYLFMQLVDAFGNIPYTEALKGETIKSPKYDDAAFIYDELIKLLTEAKVDLNGAITAVEPRLAADLVYGTSASGAIQYGRWIKAANTIMLRLYLNIRKADAAKATAGINSLITENNFISTNAEDFQLVFGNTQAPLTRHPIFQQEYAGTGKGFYMTNYFMYHMILKSDPRLPFYIFRQGTDAQVVVGTNDQNRPCRTKPNCIYGWLSVDPQNKGLAALPVGSANGYVGRDHGDDTGIPGDTQIRATFGVYPVGGSYDKGPGGGARTINSGASGAGLMPWMTNFMRAFMLAEASLTLGTPGTPLTLLVEGVNASMAKVETFGRAADPIAPAMTTVGAYVTAVTNAYNAAASDDARLNIIITEKYFANFGNGMEAFTDYRRTGKPANLPPSLFPQGPAPRRFLLPPAELSSNSNAPNPPPLIVDRIFWDKI